MNDAVYRRLAEKLIKCPLCRRICESLHSFRIHLCQRHGTDICRAHESLRPDREIEDIDNPTRLFFCAHCLDFVVADTESPRISAIEQHIREAHPNPCGPIQLSFCISTDPTRIATHMHGRRVRRDYQCTAADCRKIYASVSHVSEHWIDEHFCSGANPVTTEEARAALEAEPERIRPLVARCLEEMAADEARTLLAWREPDDGYVIHHSPDVPRVRSNPTSHYVYIERECLSMHQRELEELLAAEALDDQEEQTADWQPDRQITVHTDLTFCNILDGFIPLVKAVRSILPPLNDGELIDVQWEDDTSNSFPCKVSRSKRAIYSTNGKLKQCFREFPSGIRLYITRIHQRRYRLNVRPNQHLVRNCKVFVPDGPHGWSVVIRDEVVPWETGDYVFRSQLPFEQMDALHAEARRTNLSVRDAVYKAMSWIARSEAVHVRQVYDVVFLGMRTCSLSAVWAEFRPEHECYFRVEPGMYRFDPTKSLPRVVVQPSQQPTGERHERGDLWRASTWEIAILRSFEALGGEAKLTPTLYNKIESGEFIELTEAHLRPQEAAKGRKAYQQEVRAYIANMCKSGELAWLGTGRYKLTDVGRQRLRMSS